MMETAYLCFACWAATKLHRRKNPHKQNPFPERRDTRDSVTGCRLILVPAMSGTPIPKRGSHANA